MVAGNINDNPPKAVSNFMAHIVILDDVEKIIEGYNTIINCHTVKVTCKLSEILSKIDRRICKKSDSKHLRNEDSVLVKLTPSQPICIENFSDYPTLGRFLIREGGRIIAVGVVIETNKIDIKCKLLPFEKITQLKTKISSISSKLRQMKINEKQLEKEKKLLELRLQTITN